VNIAVLGVAAAVIALAIKYLVIDLLQSETEAMTQFRGPVASARSQIDAVEYRDELARLYLEIFERHGDSVDAHASVEERRVALVMVLSGADYSDRINKIYAAAKLLAELDQQFKSVRAAGQREWLWGLASIVGVAAWAGASNVESLTGYAPWLGLFEIVVLLRAGYGRIRYEMSKRRLGKLVNDHS